MRAAFSILIAIASVACSGGSAPPVGQTTFAIGSPVADATFAIRSPQDGATVSVAGIVVAGTAPAGARVVHDISSAPDSETIAGPSGNWAIVVVELEPGANQLT